MLLRELAGERITIPATCVISDVETVATSVVILNKGQSPVWQALARVTLPFRPFVVNC